MNVNEIARLVDGVAAEGGEIEIAGVAKIEEARSGDITFLANPKYQKHLITTAASAVLVGFDAYVPEVARRATPLALIRVADPYAAFLRVLDRFQTPAPSLPPGIHPSAVVGSSSRIAGDASIGAHAVIGERCAVGDGTSIHPGAVVGNDVRIGAGTTIYPNVTIREGCIIGDRVILHAGTVVGSDGFGFAPRPDGTYEKIPQRGIVVIEDDVEIGANCTIDRATLGETRIHRGVKLDNLIHVAHNVVIGEHTVMAAQTGVSGSTKIGSHCAFGGQVGLVGHITIADRTTIGAQSGVPKSIDTPGKTWFGYPAREIHESLRIEGVVHQLPSMFREIQEMERRIGALERRAGGDTHAAPEKAGPTGSGA